VSGSRTDSAAVRTGGEPCFGQGGACIGFGKSRLTPDYCSFPRTVPRNSVLGQGTPLFLKPRHLHCQGLLPSTLRGPVYVRPCSYTQKCCCVWI
jgi:hypothetical protein